MSGASGLRKHDHSSDGQGGTIASSGAPADATYLTTTANGTLSAEVVVGATPGGELGGSWGTPTVDSTHSGSAHTDFIAKAIIDAKGDLIVGTAADTAARKAVGANDTILMADSGQSDGLKWVASQTPSTQAFGDSAAEGTADTYARGDHKHAMPATPATGIGPILIADDHSTPLIFADLLQTEAADDLLYAES